MEKVRIENYNGKDVLIVDYSNCKEADMIDVLKRAKLLIKLEHKAILLLSIFNNKNYMTPRFIRHFEKEYKEVESLIHKIAVIGISDVQNWILKGVNLWTSQKIYSFTSFDEALKFLVSEEGN